MPHFEWNLAIPSVHKSTLTVECDPALNFLLRRCEQILLMLVGVCLGIISFYEFCQLYTVSKRSIADTTHDL
ncbi:hypothetical protein BDV39DRAFT_165446 [Aspergillus sergii]|uniref:Uncharacterized protein n=1 Tax=Aspergillus sergii TaxID=1034303 RepID=A0A5N6XM60_9EURO|nr:hypothetical protein BDV39DRAFT_165446 [Aspergillus sergii]